MRAVTAVNTSDGSTVMDTLIQTSVLERSMLADIIIALELL